MNKVMIIGRFTKDMNVKYTASSAVYLRNTIAVDSYGGNGEKTTDFIPVVVWGSKAERISKYFKKGSQIAVEGAIKTRNYDDENGKKVYVTEVLLYNFWFVGSVNKNSKDENNSFDNIQQNGIDIFKDTSEFGDTSCDSDDMPF